MKKQLFIRHLIRCSFSKGVIIRRITILFVILLVAVLSSVWAQDKWTLKDDFGGGARWGGTGFSIGTKGYIGTGYKSGTYYKDFWEYDPDVNSWTQKADFGGSARYAATSFSIGSKGYIGTGFSNGVTNDFWEYDPSTNNWTQKANVGGGDRHYATGFSIADKGYIGTGYGDGNMKDFWEYDPDANTWTQKTDFEGSPRCCATGFSIGSKGYIGTGDDVNGYYLKDFWEYDPSTDTWLQKANFGGSSRQWAIGFSIGDRGYIGTGYVDVSSYANDFWEFDPAINAWTQKANCGGTTRYSAIGFSIGSKGYIGTGSNYPYYYYDDLWEYTPDGSSCIIPNVQITPQGNLDICTTGFVNLITTGGNNYSYHWNRNNLDIPGATNQFYHAKKTGNYRVRVVDDVGCHAVSKKTVVYASCKLDDQQSDELASEMKLYPNPTIGQFVIELTLANEVNTPATIQVINTLGQIVYDEITPMMNGLLQKEIQLTDGEDGIYLVKVIINDQVYSGQISYQK